MKKLMLGLMMAFAVTAEAAWSKGGTGTETDPWNIGMSSPYTDVQAWTNGAGRLTITGAGEMGTFATPPWPKTIKEVVVGDGVTSIGGNAFYKCGSLTSVEMPSVASIEGNAFNSCDLLESVEMPSVTSIGGSAFMFCTELTSITILTKDPPTCSGGAFFQVPTTCTMFILPDADVDVWRSALSSADYQGGFKTVSAIADGKSCYTSIDVNTAIANGCKEIVFCADCNWGLVVPADVKTTFDLCGKTLAGALTVNGSLTVEDTSDQKTGRVTGEVSVGTNGSFIWNGSQNWTVSSEKEIKGAIGLNKLGVGIVVTMGDDIADAVELPAGESLTIDLNGKTFGGALTVNGDLTVNDTSDQKTGRVTGAVSVGADGSFIWNGNKNWTVSSATEIKNAIEANKFGAGIAVTMNGTIEGAAEIPAGQSLSVNGFTFNSPSEPVIPDDKVLVTKESLQAAKAMTVQIVNGQVALGVSVCSNADITASSANWAPVKFTPDTQIGLSEDGTKLILPIPVAAQQGFMILQSGDAKVSEGEVRGPVIGEPWYKPTVED